jgi:hypothetical protein
MTASVTIPHNPSTVRPPLRLDNALTIAIKMLLLAKLSLLLSALMLLPPNLPPLPSTTAPIYPSPRILPLSGLDQFCSAGVIIRLLYHVSPGF